MPTLAIRSGDLVLEGHLLVPEEPRAVVVLLHGIPGGGHIDPSDPGYAGLASTFAEHGYAALHFDFRGVRGQPGEFSLGGWAADLAAALDSLDGALDPLARVLIGSSAGGAVAIRVASRRPDVAAVATLATPAGFEALPGPEAAIARFRNSGIIHDPGYPPDVGGWWDDLQKAGPERFVARVAPRPLLIVHGDSDDVVPYQHAERLFASAAEPKELIRIPGGGHQLRRDPRALAAVLDWADHLPTTLSVQGLTPSGR